MHHPVRMDYEQHHRCKLRRIYLVESKVSDENIQEKERYLTAAPCYLIAFVLYSCSSSTTSYTEYRVEERLGYLVGHVRRWSSNGYPTT